MNVRDEKDEYRLQPAHHHEPNTKTETNLVREATNADECRPRKESSPALALNAAQREAYTTAKKVALSTEAVDSSHANLRSRYVNSSLLRTPKLWLWRPRIDTAKPLSAIANSSQIKEHLAASGRCLQPRILHCSIGWRIWEDMAPEGLSRIGLAGLAVMGQNLALNIAEKGFPISVYNRSASKVDETVERAKEEGNLPVRGFHDAREFVESIQKPRCIIILVKAGAPVDQTIELLSKYLEKGDCIIDGGNEWYENTERRAETVKAKGLLYLGMGVSGGEEGARHGPSLMPGGTLEAYKYIEDIVQKVAAQVNDGPCVTYVGPGGAGNFVKMVHNGIEYGDMELIAEAYDVLKSVGGLSNKELHETFFEWNKGELESFLIEITADIFSVPDDKGEGQLVDKVLDKTGMKGTGKWTVQQAAELSVAAPTIATSLDLRFLSG